MKTLKTMQKKKMAVVLLLAAAAVMVVLFLTIGSSGKRLERQLALGQKYLDAADYEQAIAAFQKAIDLNPESPDAYLGLAGAYRATDQNILAYQTLLDGVTALKSSAAGETAAAGNADDPSQSRLEEQLRICQLDLRPDYETIYDPEDLSEKRTQPFADASTVPSVNVGNYASNPYLCFQLPLFDGEYSYTLNEDGFVTRIEMPGNSSIYGEPTVREISYDGNGNPTKAVDTVSDMDSYLSEYVFSYDYDGDGRLSAIEETFDGQSFTLGLSYDADGRLATFTLGGGSTVATFSYDEDGRFTEGLSNDGGGRCFYDSNGFVRESISYQTDSDLQIVGPVGYDVYHYPDEIQPLLGEYTTQFPDLQQ